LLKAGLEEIRHIGVSDVTDDADRVAGKFEDVDIFAYKTYQKSQGKLYKIPQKETV